MSVGKIGRGYSRIAWHYSHGEVYYSRLGGGYSHLAIFYSRLEWWKCMADVRWKGLWSYSRIAVIYSWSENHLIGNYRSRMGIL